MAISFLLNGRERTVSRGSGAVLLDVLRDDLGLTGTKDGCREGDCGSCLVLLGAPDGDGIVYRAVNSCLFPLGEADGRHVVTIEGLNQAGLTPVQKALVDEGAIQCGFCTPGLVVALTGFLIDGASLSAADGIAALGGNICRCTGYASIRRAAGRLSGKFGGLEAEGGPSSAARIAALVEKGILPGFFLDAPVLLRSLKPDAGDEAGSEDRPAASPVLVAGGTDLFVTRADELRDSSPAFLSRRKDLLGIRVEDGECRIGAATPLAEIERSRVVAELVPGLGRCFARIASPAVRNRATVAGNIVNASPAGDLSVIFLALDATVTLARDDRERRVRLRDFFRGYKVLDMAADEMIVEISFPVPGAGACFHFEKVCRRESLDIAAASSAILLRVGEPGRILDAHVSAGSVAPIPLYLRETSDLLRGRNADAETARSAADTAAREISPISDVRGSAGYRRELLPRLILAHFLSLFPDRVREEEFA